MPEKEMDKPVCLALILSQWLFYSKTGLAIGNRPLNSRNQIILSQLVIVQFLVQIMAGKISIIYDII